MPILAAETSMFPEHLFDDPSAESLDYHWSVVHTKSRQEKALARQLLLHKLSFYLPLVPKDNHIRGRRVRSYVPLFSGYIFLLGTEEQRGLVLPTNRIACILPVTDQTPLRADLTPVFQLITSNSPLTIERRLMPGRQVRVIAGPMIGMEGTVIQRRGGFRLLIAVNFMQQGASVAVDDYMVEPLDNGRSS